MPSKRHIYGVELQHVLTFYLTQNGPTTPSTTTTSHYPDRIHKRVIDLRAEADMLAGRDFEKWLDALPD
ncbi:hypothetical protein AU193_03455 [Mycobacterium sp. GA-1285]|uniref:hypothetical protein n=1 Tax=Mycobacterium sp. GA-1285 TaxID=1772282 RepID=UPI000748F7C4|nr:hypothetical protein [Mycobacterium sp. GA-1285]KUI21460.1 hypothetical protein AU193_03455 [Mycobacterium sp. GA-1285]